MTTYFTELEYIELGEAFATGDLTSARAVYHLAEKRREIERLRAEGRLS